MMETMPAFGPGITTGGGCDFRSSLSTNLLNRMDTQKVLKAEAVNLATAKSELGDIDPIGIYRLFVGKTTYKNKVTGDIVTETTLLSPNSNNEGPGVWTDAGEHGTGTKEEYQAILGRARELANTEGAASMFWVSPAKTKRVDGMPEHRAYLWKKNAKGEVTAYAYQLTGSIDTLSKTFSHLSTNASLFDSQSLLWRSSDDTISHKKIFDAYKFSLTREERDKAKDFLDRFQQETVQSDSVLSERIEKYKEQYEQQLQEVYEGDIESAVEVLASGFIALARDNGTEETTVSVQQDASKPVEHSRLIGEDIKTRRKEEHQENVPDIAIPITLAILAAYDRQKEESKFIPSLDTNQEEKRKDSSILELFDEQKRIEELSIDEKRLIEVVIQEEMIEPVVPALITLLYLIPHDGEEESDGVSFTSDIVIFAESDYSDDGILPLATSIIALLLSPQEQNGEESRQDDTEMTSEEEIRLFFSESAALLPSGPADGQEHIYKSIESVFTELSLVLGEREEGEEHIPYEVETEIADIAQEIFTLLSGEKGEGGEKAKCLSLYNQKETSLEMKELLSLFLYEEIKTLGKEHKEMALYEPLFEKRKILVSEILWQLLSTEIHNAGNLTPEFRKRVGILLFLLYILHKNEEEKLSLLVEAIEQLKKFVFGEVREDNIDGYLFQLERLLISKQKKKRGRKKTGIIYWFWQNEYYRLISLSLTVVNGVEM